jgi:hypothetical protein
MILFSQLANLTRWLNGSFNYFNGLDLAKWPFSQRLYNWLFFKTKLFGQLATIKGVFGWLNKISQPKHHFFMAEILASWR